MATLFDLLQGSYAYLLITLIVAVTGLFLGLLWLVVQRVKRSQTPDTIGQGVREKENENRVDLAEVLELRERIAQLEAEGARGKLLFDENKMLREKVRYLESKLLEYEILQEEIGTLSALKLENEALKEELVGFQQDPAPRASQETVYYADPPTAAPSPIQQPKGPSVGSPPGADGDEGLSEDAFASMMDQVEGKTETAIADEKKRAAG